MTNLEGWRPSIFDPGETGAGLVAGPSMLCLKQRGRIRPLKVLPPDGWYVAPHGCRPIDGLDSVTSALWRLQYPPLWSSEFRDWRQPRQIQREVFVLKSGRSIPRARERVCRLTCADLPIIHPSNSEAPWRRLVESTHARQLTEPPKSIPDTFQLTGTCTSRINE
jgi:hypothetical protein